ncbi:MAG TPA: transporter, partial [Thermoanaerobaculia bacterium]|nr:transporter [Thermoanaerobaculia bacterium]
MTVPGRRIRLREISLAASLLAGAATAKAQNRGVYPLGMSALNSGVLPSVGFTYANQLLYYSRDHARDDEGHTLPVRGENFVLMDMNTLSWVSSGTILGGATFSASATLPVAKNSLTTDVEGKVSGGSGFADSYYLPVILGWSGERFAVRAMYGFLAPTGRFEAGATDNVGSGYWTHTLSSGQTFFAGAENAFALSVFEMYEFHTTQEGTG